MEDKIFISRILTSFIGRKLHCLNCPLYIPSHKKRLLGEDKAVLHKFSCNSLKMNKREEINLSRYLSCQELVLLLIAEFCLNSKEILDIKKKGK